MSYKLALFSLYFVFLSCFVCCCVCVRAPYCQMLRSSWCWWKSKMHHNTFVVATVLLGPLSNPRNRGEADLICGQILTPASFPFPPSSLLTIISTEVGFPGRGGLLSCCFQLDLGTNTDLISGQILVRSRAQILAPATGCSVRLFAFTSPDSTPVVLHLVDLII